MAFILYAEGGCKVPRALCVFLTCLALDYVSTSELKVKVFFIPRASNRTLGKLVRHHFRWKLNVTSASGY